MRDHLRDISELCIPINTRMCHGAVLTIPKDRVRNFLERFYYYDQSRNIKIKNRSDKMRSLVGWEIFSSGLVLYNFDEERISDDEVQVYLFSLAFENPPSLPVSTANSEWRIVLVDALVAKEKVTKYFDRMEALYPQYGLYLR